jgi:fluoride ion exporter CrcB/FEX
VTLVLIAAGGAAGAVARYLVDNAVLDRFGGAFPLGILSSTSAAPSCWGCWPR